MKHMKTIDVPATTREVVAKVTCDLCATEITQKQFEVNEVEVSLKQGSNYPEGGSGDTTSFDLCSKCFAEKLIPWLRAQGAEPATKEWDC